MTDEDGINAIRSDYARSYRAFLANPSQDAAVELFLMEEAIDDWYADDDPFDWDNEGAITPWPIDETGEDPTALHPLED